MRTTKRLRFRFSILPRPRPGLSTQVALGLILGLVVGVCVGERAAVLQGIGKAFILLLQMTVLPYITLSLITGLGRLSYQDITTLALKVGALLVGSWVLAFAAMLLMPLAFPPWESASFFSTSLVEPLAEMHFLTLFIPSNPFNALANNIVPAVVLFSIAVGVALIGMEEKQGIITDLTILTQAMIRVTNFVSWLTPLGVFAIVASAAGTMSIEEFGRVQIYVMMYMALALFLTFWVLPVVITSALPLTYRAVVGQTSDVMITAFATGSALIVLPLLVERSKVLLRQSRLSTPDTEAAVEVIIPAFTSFPKIGTLLPMSFVLFAGWFAGSPVSAEYYPTFIGSGLLSFFGNVNVAIPLMLDLLHIPADLFQLYLAISVVTGHFTTLLTTMNNLMLTLVGACAVGGLLTVDWGRVVRHTVLTVVCTAVLIGGARAVFYYTFDHNKVRDYIPQATLVVLPSIREFFDTHGADLDAFVFSAEAGSAWTLLYPAYTVAIPQPDVLAIPLAYPMPRGDPELVSVVNTWIELKKKDKTIATLYDYWILGKNAVPKQPRWSVIRNVLHWVN